MCGGRRRLELGTTERHQKERKKKKTKEFGM